MISDLFHYVASNIMHRFTRSLLTILSILIGIMAIFAIISFGQGLSKYVNDLAKQSGTDKLIVMPLGAGAPGETGISLTADDLNFVKKVKGVAEATGMMMKQSEVKIDKDKRGIWTFIAGMPTEPSEQRIVDEAFGGIGILKGRNLKKGDTDKVVLGYNYQKKDKIFPKALNLGDKILINEFPLEIIGFYEEVGNPSDDANVYLSNDQVKKIFNVPDDEYGGFYLRAQPNVVPSELADKIKEKLRKKKGQKEGQEDFEVQTFEQLIETFGVVLTILNAILVIIAGISVAVAAVNIMNTMYTAVLERTKEIGIMKAIGASNGYIMFIFFIESGMLGLIGGSMGIGLGYVVSQIGGAIAGGAGYQMLKPYYPLSLIIGCLVGSFIVGALSGFFPAMSASKQNPVEALRYE